jgi:hypothetical protein
METLDADGIQSSGESATNFNLTRTATSRPDGSTTSDSSTKTPASVKLKALAPAVPPSTNLEGGRAVLLQQLVVQQQRQPCFIQDQRQEKDRTQANSNKMALQAATKTPALPIPPTKMAVHVAGPAAVTVPTESTAETIPCVDFQPRRFHALSSPKKESKCEARFQDKNAAEARVGGRKREGDATVFSHNRAVCLIG